jgi:hypothetical protein
MVKKFFSCGLRTMVSTEISIFRIREITFSLLNFASFSLSLSHGDNRQFAVVAQDIRRNRFVLG